MGRAFEYRKATKLKRWGNMARTFTRIGKQIAIAVKAGGPDPENNPHLRAVVATAKRENMPKDNVERAIKNAMGKDQKDYKEMNYEGYGPFGIAVFVETATDNTTRTVANVRSVLSSAALWELPVALTLCSVGNRCLPSLRKKVWRWMN